MKTVEEIDLATAGPRNQDVVQLPLGLLGFEQFKEYLWLQSPEEAPFCWLQACQDPSLTFLLVPPFSVLSEYAPELTDEDVRFLGLTCPEDAVLFGIVTLRPNGRGTVNLKGPLVINRSTLRAKQVVVANAADYALQHPLPAID
jgi:flagellar assembly factor FliW